MSQSYKVNVNQNYDFEIGPLSISQLNIVETTAGYDHVLQDHVSYRTEITEADFNNKSYEVKVNNNIYKINIYTDLDILIKELGFEIGNAKKVDKISAPMPGLILEINVSIDDEVMENDPLLILEAMKMENIISSPRDGKIKTISIKKGDAVEKNQLLIEFE